MRASLYLFSEKNETRWDAGFTLSPSVTQWWLEEEGKRFQGLITPALPLYFAFFLLGKVKNGLNAGEDAVIEKVEGWIREAIQRIDRSLALNAKDLWEKSKGKPYSDGLKIWKREWLEKDGEVLRPLIEGRFCLLEQVEDYLDQVNRPLYGELAIRDQLLEERKGANGPTDVEREERRAFRRRYLPMLIQYLHHRGELSLTSGMVIVESDRGPLLRCQRCSSEYRRWHGYPCGVCEHDDMVCEVCSAMGASKGCKPILFSPTRPKETAPSSFTLLPSFLAWEGELTPAQQEASQMASQFVQGTLPRTDRRELLIWAVTGAGKTEVVFQAVDMALRQGKRVLLATPRKDVVLELTPRFRRAFPSVPMVSLYGGSRQKGKMGELVIATTHQALNFFHAFPLVIVDEIDAFPFHNSPMLHFAVNRATAAGGKRILLTATPSEKMLQQVKKGEILQATIPSRFHGHPLPVPILRYESRLEEKIGKGKLPQGVRHFLNELHRNGRQAFLFVPRIGLVEDLVALIKETFPQTEGTYAGEPLREEKVSAFRRGEIRLLVTTTILERGVTIPFTDALVLMADAPIFDESSLVQIAGRVGRSAEDPGGKVLFLSESRSRSMVKAVRQIEGMNREARKRGFLVEEKKKNRLIRLFGGGSAE